MDKAVYIDYRTTLPIRPSRFLLEPLGAAPVKTWKVCLSARFLSRQVRGCQNDESPWIFVYNDENSSLGTSKTYLNTRRRRRITIQYLHIIGSIISAGIDGVLLADAAF
jgi:hypothetical protein